MDMKKGVQYTTLMYLTNSGFSAGLILFLPFLTKELHLSLTQAGLLGGIGYLSKILLSFPIIVVAGKLGGYRTLVWATVCYMIGFFITGFSNAYLLLILSFLVAGVGFSTFQPVSLGIITRVTQKEERGKIMGIFTSSADLGRIAIAGALSFLAAKIGWRETAILSGFIILFFVIYTKITQPKEEYITSQASTNHTETISKLLKNQRLLLSTCTAVFDSVASSSLFIFIPFLLLKRGIPSIYLSIFIALFFLGGLLGKLYLGKLTDHFHSSLVFIIAEASMAIAILLLANIPVVILTAIFALVLGVLTKGTVPAAITMATESVEQDGTFEHAYAFNLTFIAIANGLTPIFLGFISDHYGIVAAFNICALFALLATVPALLYFRSHKRRVAFAENIA